MTRKPRKARKPSAASTASQPSPPALTFAAWRAMVLAAGPGAGDGPEAHDDDGDGEAEGEESPAAGECQVNDRLDARLGGPGRRRRGGRQSLAFMKSAKRRAQ